MHEIERILKELENQGFDSHDIDDIRPALVKAVLAAAIR